MSTADSTPNTHITADAPAAVPIAEDLLARVLEPYSCKGCRYLIDAESAATANSLIGYGDFRINESAYIRSTGHFNAVEMLLCFNQLAYSAFAAAVINDAVPEFRGWSIDDYCHHQLASMMIRTTSSRFKKPINAQKFSARLLCQDWHVVERTQRYLLIPCVIEFWDDHGGAASGEIELAVFDIP